ncbi:copper chaperone PCu(A)C [Halomonas elongata]|uniref:copper chaperone PCu(A)C n=1 Tax=Halomonas elongata TaxID=2746 RepID=UPI00255B27B2|nr:copper chaperone PCu(A)C [Halomonas elongata]MDL4864461.1 copper chaperone PCu(A)C [Halomonas elongata]
MTNIKRELKRRISAVSLGSLAACLLLAPLGASAEDLEVTDARMRLLPGDMPAAGYFRLHNRSEQPVVLVRAQSDAFGSIEMHRSMNHDGMASMEAVPRLELSPDEHIEFAPQGYHLMLMDQVGSLSVGDSVDITLEFEQRDPLTVGFKAVSPTSM